MNKRNCTKCIAYCNHLSGQYDKCGLGFEYIEELESTKGGLAVTVHPLNGSCNSIARPATKEEFVRTAAELGIEWNIEDVVSLDDMKWF